MSLCCLWYEKLKPKYLLIFNKITTHWKKNKEHERGSNLGQILCYCIYNKFWLLMPHCRTRPLFFSKKTVFSTERERERNDEIYFSYLLFDMIIFFTIKWKRRKTHYRNSNIHMHDRSLSWLSYMYLNKVWDKILKIG